MGCILGVFGVFKKNLETDLSCIDTVNIRISELSETVKLGVEKLQKNVKKWKDRFFVKNKKTQTNDHSKDMQYIVSKNHQLSQIPSPMGSINFEWWLMINDK